METCDERGCPAIAGITVVTHAGNLHFCLHHARSHFTLVFDEVFDGGVVLLKFDGTVEFRQKISV